MPLTADITSDIPVPSRTAASTVHRTMREFVAYVQQYHTLPDIPVASINIQDDDYPSGLVITEDMPLGQECFDVRTIRALTSLVELHWTAKYITGGTSRRQAFTRVNCVG